MNVIQENDARAMIRLLGATAACGGGHQKKKRFLMQGLAELIQADAWVWTLTCRLNPAEPQLHVGYLYDGFSEDQFACFLRAIEKPAMTEGARLFFEAIVEDGSHTTMSRIEMDPEGILARDEKTNQLWLEAGLGDVIMNGFPLNDHSMSGVAVYRHKNAPDFTERQKKIAHIILGEVPWLHMSGWPEDRGATVPQLFPRQRMVLNLLLDGLGRKQIAHHLEITENTVAGYVKDIYRHFEVRSQPELMKKFLSGQSTGC